MFKQCEQKLKRLLLQLDKAAAFAQLTGSAIQFKRAEPEDGSGTREALRQARSLA